MVAGLVAVILFALLDAIKNLFLMLINILVQGAEKLLCFDLQLITNEIPIIGVVYDSVIPAVALAILLINITTSYARPLLSFDPESKMENPLLITIKALIFSVGIFYSSSLISEFILKPLQAINKIMNDTIIGSHLVGNGSFNWDNFVYSMNSQADAMGTVFNSNNEYGRWGVFLVVAVMLFSLISLLLEVGQRYVTFALTIFCGPLAFAMGATKSTNDIFHNWAKFLIGNGAVMLLTTFLYKCLLSLLFSVNKAMEDMTAFVIWLVLSIAIPAVAKKLDTFVNQLGMLAPRTDGGGQMLLYTTTRMLTSNFSSISNSGRKFLNNLMSRDSGPSYKPAGIGISASSNFTASSNNNASASSYQMHRSPSYTPRKPAAARRAS